MESGYYPPGAENDPNAPYNQPSDPDPVAIEVTVSVTLSKVVTVEVDDYGVEVDDYDRVVDYDFSDCDLYKAVEEQITLPQNLAEYTERMFKEDLDLKAAKMPRFLKDAIEDGKGWCVDDFEVVRE